MGRVLPRSEARAAANLGGKYRLIAELGQGGMATVYLAVALGDSGFRKLAVIKLLRPEFAIDEEFIQMFLDEARLCARLSHPNIVHTYDVGVEDGEHLIAMEYLDGVSLHAASAKLGKDSLFNFPLRAKVLLEVIEGLRYAHELCDYDRKSLQIVHRDVTPHNIFLTYDGQVKLLDFGIAKAATSSVKTATGVIKGKLTYMAPEQARGEPVDARADLYAVGVMLWEAVTGRRRWPTGISEPALFTRLAIGELPERPNAASRGLPAEIDDIVMRTLAPKPEDRYQTAAELRDVLDAVMRNVEPVSLRNLSTMLSKTFAEDRRRIREVIEDQFRTLESGAAPSEPHQLPAVPYPSVITSSNVTQSPALRDTGPHAGGELVQGDPILESQSRRITEPAPVHSRVVFLIAGALIATAFGVGVVIPRVHSGHAARDPAIAPASSLVATVANSASATSDPGTHLEPARPMADTIQHDEAAPPGDGSNRHGLAAVTPTRLDPRPPAPARVQQTTPPSASAPSAASTDAVSKDPALLRSPQTRPKVQLERDNPWP